MDEIENGSATVPEGEKQVEAANTPESATGEVVEQNNEAKKSPDAWALKRIGEITAKRHAADARAAEAEAKAARYEEQIRAMQANPNGESQPQGDIHQLAQAYAKQIADQQLEALTFNQRCNSVAEEGKKEIPDFQASLDNLNQYFGLSKEFLDVATNVDGAHKVLWYLGKPENFERFEQISKMSPVKQAIELTKLNSVASKALQKPVSNAPTPIEPVSGKGGSDGVPDVANTKDWIRHRNENARRKR